MSDKLTVLTATGRLSMTKTWRSDGTITPNDTALNCTMQTATVSDIRSLSRTLTKLSSRWQSCLIRGAPRGDALVDSEAQQDPHWRKGCVLRRLEVFKDQALHWIMIDVDGYRPTIGHPVLDPLPAIEEFIASHLPQFVACSYHWQLSGRAGAPGAEGTLKCHLHFWLATPRTSAQLYAWAKDTPGIDKAVFRVVQPNYTADPVFESGVANPVPLRSGFAEGAASDEVTLVLTEAQETAQPADLVTIKPRRAEDALPDATADYIGAGNWECYGVDAKGRYQVLCPWHEHHTGDNGPTQCVYTPAGVGGVAEGGVSCLHEDHDGRGKLTTTLFRHLIGETPTTIAQDFDVVAVPDAAPVYLEPGQVLWQPFETDAEEPQYLTDSKGQPILSAGNLQMVLSRPDLCGARIGFDEFKAAIMIEWRDALGAWRPLRDTDYFKLKVALEGQGFKKVGTELVREAVARVAEIHQFDSAIQWITALEWDGVPRVERFFVDCFSVEDTAYSRAVGRYTWTALAGRVVRPGCQADMTPILIGGQGLRKTSGVKAMCPTPDAFVELALDIHDDNLARKIRGKLVGEIGELRGMAGKDAEAIKQWFTRQVEEWTPKYREFGVSFPRRLIMLGTGNNAEFLEDSTGARRFLPMTVIGQVDTARIAAERDQLWAEGRHLFCAGGHAVEWRDAEDLAKEHHHQYRVHDVWEPSVLDWLARDPMDGHESPTRGEGFVTVAQVLTSALGLQLARINKNDQKRVTDILTHHGFVKARQWNGGDNTRGWVNPKWGDTGGFA